ncbi:MAG: ATP-dependent helicase UvrD/PcrA [Campylobacterota bacterium]|nr:ATP-dependent helicase UvrD/PcrA [Campylobacterota bacterium]
MLGTIMNKETLKNELQTDYSTYTTNDNYPFFHRIKFDSTNIYLTKTSFSNRIRDNGLAIYEDPLLGANYQGFYRYFPWSDIRAKEFLQFELGADLTH